MKTLKEITEEELKDFDITQTKIWQLPVTNSFERQTLAMIREWVEKSLSRAYTAGQGLTPQ